MHLCKRFIVSGRVQGVWYRREAKNKAKALRLTGYAKNLDSGDVEVVAFGSKGALDQFETWLWKGPLLAKVNRVISEPLSSQPFNEFETL